jgi:tetratricopeptide (TPR) repeat protein
MADPIDDLVQRWRRNPNAATTVALCDALRESPRKDLVSEIGTSATQRHGADVAVLVPIARMYLQAEMLGEAQNVLVSAGKHAPRDARVYRWLGEVLLRKGDATRAEKVLERAVQLGAGTAPSGPGAAVLAEAKFWLERSRVFRPMQASAGDFAVAAEVMETGPAPLPPPAAPKRASAPRTLPYDTEVNAHSVVPRGGPVAAPRFAPAPAQTPPPTAAFRVKPPPIAAAPVAVSPRAVSPLPPVAPPPRTVSPLPPVAAPPVAPPSRVAPSPAFPSLPVAPPSRVAPAPIAAPPPRDAASPMPAAQSALVPYPRDVLDALALSGLFESDFGAATGWDRPGSGPKRKGTALLVCGLVGFLGSTVGTYFFYKHKRAAEHVRAEAILTTVDAQLHAGQPDSLPEMEQELAHALTLESRSRRAALAWTRERALVGLVKSGADIAFEDALARAKDVGIEDEQVAFARVASFLFQGDTAGAAAVLPRWDGPAANDAWYQLVTGAALERAGDPRARARYAEAAKLDPALFVAQIGLIRVTSFAGDSEQATRMAREIRAKEPSRAEPVALVALTWGRDPLRETLAPPPEAEEVMRRGEELPTGLKFVPHAVAALRGLDRHAIDDARTEVRAGLAAADSPGAAVWLGAIALDLDDDELARKAALAALQLSAVYEPARALAARVALHSARLDEALKATEELDASGYDVVVVRAAAAYERIDPDGVALALQALRPDDRKVPVLAGLASAIDTLLGKWPTPAKHPGSSDDAPWADLIGMDAALDSGDLGQATTIATAWGKEAESMPLRAIRLARLARYSGRLDEADTRSQLALEHGTVTPRVLTERVFELVARERFGEVAPLLARYPLVLGPLTVWLNAYAMATAGSTDPAKAKLAALDPPPAGAPFETRLIAAAALGATKDHKRGADYDRDLLATGSLNPDLTGSALALGFRRVEHGRRRATYEGP